MKCVFCGSKKDVEEREDGLQLCNACFEISNKAKIEREEEEAMKDNKVDVDFENKEKAVEEEVVEKELSDIRCEVILGVKETGELYFNAGGNNPDLLTIDGLMKFGVRRMDQIWDARETASPEAGADSI